jgi:hypothetical protein
MKLNDSENEDIDWGNDSSKRGSSNKEENKSLHEERISGGLKDEKNSENIHDMYVIQLRFIAKSCFEFI